MNYKASFEIASNLQNEIKDEATSTPKVKKYREPEPEPRKDASNTPPPPDQMTFDGQTNRPPMKEDRDDLISVLKNLNLPNKSQTACGNYKFPDTILPND